MKLNKRIKLILILSIISIIIGILLPAFINKDLIKSRVEAYIPLLITNKVKRNTLLLRTSSNNLIENNLICFMPLLHLIPISILIYNIKSITIGSTISSILITYKFKGILYIIPLLIPNILSILTLSVSLYYAITYTIVRKRKLNKKKLLKKYLIIVLITNFIEILISILETYISLYYFPIFR